MLFCMRTTLNLDTALMREAKKQAADSGTTLTKLIENALRVELGRTRADEPRDRFEMPVFDGGFGLAPGVAPEDLHSHARIHELEGDPFGL